MFDFSNMIIFLEPRERGDYLAQGDVRHSLADITLARKLIGFAPKKSLLMTGLKRTIACSQKK